MLFTLTIAVNNVANAQYSSSSYTSESRGLTGQEIITTLDQLGTSIDNYFNLFSPFNVQYNQYSPPVFEQIPGY